MFDSSTSGAVHQSQSCRRANGDAHCCIAPAAESKPVLNAGDETVALSGRLPREPVAPDQDTYTHKAHGESNGPDDECDDFADLPDLDEPDLTTVLESDENNDGNVDLDATVDDNSRETVDASLDERAREQFDAQLSADDKCGPIVYRWITRIAANPKDALVLAYLCFRLRRPYSHSPRPNRGLPKPWTAQSWKDIALWTGLTKDEITDALNRLRKNGVIGWKQLQFGGVKMRHFWFDWNKIITAWKAMRKAGNDDSRD